MHMAREFEPISQFGSVTVGRYPGENRVYLIHPVKTDEDGSPLIQASYDDSMKLNPDALQASIEQIGTLADVPEEDLPQLVAEVQGLLGLAS